MPTLGLSLLGIEVVFAGTVVMWLGASGRLDGPVSLAWLAVAIVVCALLGVTTFRCFLAVVAPDSVRRIAAYIPVPDLFPVRMRVIPDRPETGVDHGVAWFANNALHFRGLLTGFVIGAQDLRFDPLGIGVGLGAFQRGRDIPTLKLRHPERAVSIELQPMDRLSPTDFRDCGYRFRHHPSLFLRRWRASRVESPYPPLRKQPSFIGREPQMATAKGAP